MNNLSLLIYFGGVFGNLGVFLAICFFLFAICGGFFALFWFMENGGKVPYLKRIIGLVFAIGFVSCIIPDKTTVYAIAASEMGEVAVKTPEAQEVLQALKSKILDQLSPATKEN